jgi:predicted enzyme related to lactoylglutathione lyase
MKFFKEVFGWTFEQFGNERYWLAISGDESTPGINGAVMKKVEQEQPVCNRSQL